MWRSKESRKTEPGLLTVLGSLAAGLIVGYITRVRSERRQTRRARVAAEVDDTLQISTDEEVRNLTLPTDDK